MRLRKFLKRFVPDNATVCLISEITDPLGTFLPAWNCWSYEDRKIDHIEPAYSHKIGGYWKIYLVDPYAEAAKLDLAPYLEGLNP